LFPSSSQHVPQVLKKRCLGTAGHRIADFLFFISKAFLVFSTENGKNGKNGKFF
jgi:hypothetical protein